VQITHAEQGLYSVTFCGLRDCFEPDSWAPDTPIVGDASYRVISPERLIIERDEYTKCSGDPTWRFSRLEKEEAPPRRECPAPGQPEAGILIGWTTGVRVTTQLGGDRETTSVGPFRPLAILDGKTLKETTGASIHEGQSFWLPLTPAMKPRVLQSVGVFLDRLGEDHCVYYGSLGGSDLPEHTLLSSQPLSNALRLPTPADRAAFARLNKTCMVQGDWPEDEQPRCTRAELLAVSDLDGNGQPEFWASEPYRWDTGLTISENRGELVPLLQVCPGCSD
jgi:hypothetical protein